MAHLVAEDLDFQGTAVILNYPGGLQSKKFALTFTHPSNPHVVNHNLGSADVVVQVYKVDVPTGQSTLVTAGVVVANQNSLNVTIAGSGAATYRVVVLA